MFHHKCLERLDKNLHNFFSLSVFVFVSQKSHEVHGLTYFQVDLQTSSQRLTLSGGADKVVSKLEPEKSIDDVNKFGDGMFIVRMLSWEKSAI